MAREECIDLTEEKKEESGAVPCHSSRHRQPSSPLLVSVASNGGCGSRAVSGAMGCSMLAACVMTSRDTCSNVSPGALCG